MTFNACLCNCLHHWTQITSIIPSSKGNYSKAEFAEVKKIYNEINCIRIFSCFFLFHFNLLLIIYLYNYLELLSSDFLVNSLCQANQNISFHLSEATFKVGDLESSEPSGHSSIIAVIPPETRVIIKRLGFFFF